MLKLAVGQKTSASPVQPMRSSRWGQSVGVSRKLPIWPQKALWISWLTLALEVSTWPMTARSEWMTQPVKSSRRMLSTPVTFTKRKP